MKPKPSLSVDETDLPAIKNWDVGKTYTITAEVKMTFQSEGREYDEWPGEQSEKPKMRARFRILSITPEKEKPKKKSKSYPRIKSAK